MATKNITTQARNSKNLSARSKEEYPIVSYLQEMNRMMENFFQGFGLVPHQEKPGAFIPNIDMLDAGKEIKITAELPGMEQDDIDISITKEMLNIKGEKKEEKEEKGKGYHRTERSYGIFNRTISLPVEVEVNKIEATFKKGILTIRLPKTEKVLREAKKIPIKPE